MSAIHLYQRPIKGTAFLADLTARLPDWTDTSRAAGGFWTAGGSMTGADLAEWYAQMLGCRIRRYSYGVIGWEGIVYELRLRRGGMTYTRSLTPELWHNDVDVYYTGFNGGQHHLFWYANADALAEYGRASFIVTLGTAETGSAGALKDRHLREYAWPRSRLSGGLTVGTLLPAAGDSLEVVCAGLWSTLNWRYFQTYAQPTEVPTPASAQIARLVAAAEFVTAGRIETNALPILLDCTVPQRLGDAIEGIAEQGDADGNIWQCGVWGDNLNYHPAPTTVEYAWRNGELWAAGGAAVTHQLVRPGCLMLDASAPTGGIPAGGTVFDDPRVGYVEQIEYTAATDSIQMAFSGAVIQDAALEARLRGMADLYKPNAAGVAAMQADDIKRNRWYVNEWFVNNAPVGWTPYEAATMRAPGAGGIG